MPAPPPVFVLPGRQRLAQGIGAVPHQPQCRPPVYEADVFDVNELQLNEVSSPSCLGGLQKQQNQW